jgi:hypothetical protein
MTPLDETKSTFFGPHELSLDPLYPKLTLKWSKVEVKVTWVKPITNHREVTGYKILLAASNGTFLESKALCNGDAQSTVMYCLVLIADLRAAPFSLTYDTLVRAMVLARNERGWSATSDANTVGAKVQVQPLAMNATMRGRPQI